MIFNYRQQHQLRRIEAGLRRADPHLSAMLGIFGQLYSHEDMPEWKQVVRVPSIRRAAHWIMAALTLAVAIGVLLGKAATEATAGRHGRRTQGPAASEADTGQGDDRDQRPPRHGRADGGLRQPDGPA